MTTDTRLGYFATPPLRYTGSKWQLAEWIIKQFPPHHVYIEPFCGAAAVFFRKHRSPVEVLNDLNGDLVHFFRILREQPDDLLYQIRFTPWSQEEYERSFEHTDDPLERARRFYVGMHMSFASTPLYKSGWRHQHTVNMRSPVVDTWRRMDGLLSAANRLMDAQISRMPATDAITHWDSPETLFYVDPPYVLSARSSGGRRRYKHEMTDEDHRQLALVLHNVKGMVILSGYHSPLYDELYSDWTILEKTSTTNGNSSSLEVMWLSPNVTRLESLPLFRALNQSNPRK